MFLRGNSWRRVVATDREPSRVLYIERTNYSVFWKRILCSTFVTLFNASSIRIKLTDSGEVSVVGFLISLLSFWRGASDRASLYSTSFREIHPKKLRTHD